MFHSPACKAVVTLPNNSGKQCGPLGAALWHAAEHLESGTLHLPTNVGQRNSDVDSLQQMFQGCEDAPLRQVPNKCDKRSTKQSAF